MKHSADFAPALLGSGLSAQVTQDELKVAQDRPKMAQDGTKMSPGWPKMTRLAKVLRMGLRWPPRGGGGPKRAEDGPECVSKMGPRWATLGQ